MSSHYDKLKDELARGDDAAFESAFRTAHDEALRLHKLERQSQAHKYVLLLRDSIKARLADASTSEKVRAKAEALHKELDEDVKIAHVEKVYAQIEDFLSNFESDDGWTLQDSDANLRILYRHQEGHEYHTIRAEGTLDCPLFNMMVVANELDLIKTWFPRYSFPMKLGLAEATCLARFGRMSELIYVLADVPFPFSNRDLALEVDAEDDLDHQSFNLVINTVESSTEATIPPCPEGVVRIECKGGAQFTFREPNKTAFKLLWELDPKIAVVPAWLMNFITMKVVKYGLYKFQDVALGIAGTEFEKRINDNKELYDGIRERLAKMLPEESLGK
eukprot:Opistho-1_new@90404